MAWTYSQSTGELKYDGIVVNRHGYSGAGTGKNNPAMQSVANVGPVPQGTYTIGAARANVSKGRWTMPLIPDPGTNTFGPTGLLIHADSIHHPRDTQPKNYVRRAVRAIRSVSDPSLEHKKRECLAYLTDAGRVAR